VQRKYKDYDIGSSHPQSNIYHFVLQIASLCAINCVISLHKIRQIAR